MAPQVSKVSLTGTKCKCYPFYVLGPVFLLSFTEYHCLSKAVHPPQRPFCTSLWWGVNSQVGNAWWGYAIRGEGHWLKNLLGRYARWKGSPCRNPEKLANADGRCWKDTLGRKRSFKTHRPPYPTRRGLVTAWQETKKLLHDES